MNTLRRRIALALFIAVFVIPAGARRRVIVTTDSVDYAPPVVANGHTGVVLSPRGLGFLSQYSATAFEDGHDGSVSTIIPVISAVDLHLTVDGSPVSRLRDWSQSLDMDSAMVTTSFRSGNAAISCSHMALRSMPFVTLSRISVKALDNIRVNLHNAPHFPSSLSRTSVTDVNIFSADGNFLISRAVASYNRGASTVSSAVCLIPDSSWNLSGNSSAALTLSRGESATLWIVTSTCNSADFCDPVSESTRQAIYAVRQGIPRLITDHVGRWTDLWKSDVVVVGDTLLRDVTTVALYSLYSSIPSTDTAAISIPPMGLSSDKYYGHIFWDADTWMVPVLAVLHPDMARSMVNYRHSMLPAARRRAAAYGYLGAMFPWESDNRGEESTPLFALTGPLEHHITADVANAAWMAYCAQPDTSWLRNVAFPLMRECADFWVSRVTPQSADGTYSILNVCGADEYAIGVDDNAFTNGAVRRALEHTAQAAGILGVAPDPRWLNIASSIRFHRFPDSRVIREHSCYNGQMTKQADTELLAFPLGIITDPDEIDRTISCYEPRIDSINGPAMSHSLLAVNYARANRHDKAIDMLRRSYLPYLRGPFHSIAETPANGNTYFVTGAAGLLQALIFGYTSAQYPVTPSVYKSRSPEIFTISLDSL